MISLMQCEVDREWLIRRREGAFLVYTTVCISVFNINTNAFSRQTMEVIDALEFTYRILDALSQPDVRYVGIRCMQSLSFDGVLGYTESSTIGLGALIGRDAGVFGCS